jgi:alpha-D-ribose 1-methylphosphonate 5-triphosphate synthase subunit PhnH
MSAVIESLAPGFADPVIEAQACFRAVLHAMSHPGRAVELPATQDAAPRLQPATASLLLTLLDAETSVRLHGALHGEAVLAWLRFHTGTRAAALGEGAPFTAARAGDLNAALWSALPLGSDEVPHDGGTLIVELPASTDTFRAAPLHRLALCGPGVQGERLIDVAGVPPAFWAWRVALQRQFPRGFDLLLVRAREVIAIPRSTHMEVTR